VLTAIDGSALPVTISIDGQATPVIDGHLELAPPNLLTVGLTLGSAGSATSQSIAVSGFYRRVTADSVVFPSIAVPELFIRRTGTSVILAAQPGGGGGVSPASLLGGAHRFTFVRDQ
jgi:hypothetical protein